MQIGVLSDSHDNVWKIDAALEHLRRAQAVIHCGDICSPFALRRLVEGLPGIPIHVVWGNNDGDVLLMSRLAQESPHLRLEGVFAELTLDGLPVAVHHYPEVARPLAASGRYRIVCCGHNHTAGAEWVGDCLLLNPGELLGLRGPSTLALVETADRSVQSVAL